MKVVHTNKSVRHVRITDDDSAEQRTAIITNLGMQKLAAITLKSFWHDRIISKWFSRWSWRRSWRTTEHLSSAFSRKLTFKALKMARVNEGLHFYPPPTRLSTNGLNHPAFTLQPQCITALCPVLISRLTEGRRLSWRGWLVTFRDGMLVHVIVIRAPLQPQQALCARRASAQS